MIATSHSLPSHRFSEGQYCQQTWKRSMLEFDRWAVRKTSWRMTKLLIPMLKPFALIHYTLLEMFHLLSQCVVVVVVWDESGNRHNWSNSVTSRLWDLNPRSIVNAFQRHVTASFGVRKIYRSECENLKVLKGCGRLISVFSWKDSKSLKPSVRNLTRVPSEYMLQLTNVINVHGLILKIAIRGNNYQILK